MIQQITLLLFLLNTFASTSQGNKSIEKLMLKSNHSIKQLKINSKERFDLSGIVKFKDAIYVIADKDWNNHIYKIDTSKFNFTVSSVKELCFNKGIDIEGIDLFGENFCFVEEGENDFYLVEPQSCKPKKVPIDWSKHGIDHLNWGNKGFEGVAVDNENKIVYFGKERQPRRIYKVDLASGEISQPFSALVDAEISGYDIADMKYENGFLYILERGLGLVTKINVKTNEKKSLSFQHLVFKNGQRLYKNGNVEYGMAEALLLTSDEIWIGIDNNGDKVTKYGESLGLKGNKPVIMIFKRPEGF